MIIEYFANDKYKVLSCMAERQISLNGNLIIKLSQQEIADMLQFSKVKVNSIIAELKTDGLLVQQSSKGKYSLTDKAKAMLDEMKNA